MCNQILVEDLEKIYRVPVRAPGIKSAFSSMFHKNYDDIPAVKDVSFSVKEGETIGLIGPNGAGKTTVLKMLSGLLYPSGGKAEVLGYVPWERSPKFLQSIALVMGNKSQLMWDIPALDTFKVLAEIYKVPAREAEQTVEELTDLLSIHGLLDRPVRNLSLGERMKCELVASLLHKPRVLYLDEPTLGLDVTTQRKLRTFIKDYKKRTNAIIMLTSHYMADVVELCERVIFIHHGNILYDGPLAALSAQLAPFKLIRITLKGALPAEFPENVYVVSVANNVVDIRVSRQDTAVVTAQLLNSMEIEDLAIEEPPIEAVIDQIYQEGTI